MPLSRSKRSIRYADSQPSLLVRCCRVGRLINVFALQLGVVPADAGTHTPCRSCWEMLLWLWVPACAGTTAGEWRSRQPISMSSLRTQGPIRRAARVGDAVECLWRKTTPCGYGSPPARGRPLVSGVKANCFNRHCERSEAIHREAKQKAGLLRCARNDGGRSVTHVRVLAARMRPRCARISAVPMGRAWGMPGADAPAASHAK
jgi:hypothetical protein